MPRELPVCVYCGNPATTNDHFPPSGFFAEKPGKGATVPCCEQCNHLFSRHEEYFRLVFSSLALESSPDAGRLYAGKIKRALTSFWERATGQRKLKNLLRRMEVVDIYSSGGIYLGKLTRMTISPADWERHSIVLKKLAAASYYLRTGKRLPSGMEHKVILLAPHQPNIEGADDVLQHSEFVQRHPAFTDGFARVDGYYAFTFVLWGNVRILFILKDPGQPT
jgi:hypothetical protein